MCVYMNRCIVHKTCYVLTAIVFFSGRCGDVWIFDTKQTWDYVTITPFITCYSLLAFIVLFSPGGPAARFTLNALILTPHLRDREIERES